MEPLHPPPHRRWRHGRNPRRQTDAAPDKLDWLDRHFLKTYAQEADDSVSLEEVRQAMARISGRLANDIRAERDEH
jgi:hypothetical protein